MAAAAGRGKPAIALRRGHYASVAALTAAAALAFPASAQETPALATPAESPPLSSPLTPALSSSPAPAPTLGELYELGTQARRRADHKAAQEVFLKMLAVAPDDGGALEGLALAQLSLRRYAEAEATLRRLNELSPASPYILGLLARAQAAQDQKEALYETYAQLARAAPEDLGARRRLEELGWETRPGLFLRARAAKALVAEGLDTPNPQRIVYEGRSGFARARAELRRGLSLAAAAELRQEAQRNDTAGFVYYDILDQTYSLGLEAKPRPGLRLDAEYGQSHLSELRGSGIGRILFSRLRGRGRWRSRGSELGLSLWRSPKFLRGAGSSRFFALLREVSVQAQAETAFGGLEWLLRAGLRDFSGGTSFRSYSVLATKEAGANLLQPRLERSQQEFFGAGPDGRLRAVDMDTLGLRWRRLAPETYRLSASYAHSLYRDANRLHELEAEALAWLPWRKEISAFYRYGLRDYRAAVEGYRSTDDEAHWLGASWRSRLVRGWWLMAGIEQGLLRDSRGRYTALAGLWELEWHGLARGSLKAHGRVGRSTVRDESYALGAEGRYHF